MFFYAAGIKIFADQCHFDYLLFRSKRRILFQGKFFFIVIYSME